MEYSRFTDRENLAGIAYRDENNLAQRRSIYEYATPH